MSRNLEITEFEISTSQHAPSIMFHVAEQPTVETDCICKADSDASSDLNVVNESTVLGASYILRSPKSSINTHHPPISPMLSPSQPAMFEKSPKLTPLKKSPHIKPLRGLEWSARMIGLGEPDHGDSSGDEDEFNGIGKGHAVAGTATLEEHLLMRALEKDFATLVILQVGVRIGFSSSRFGST